MSRGNPKTRAANPVEAPESFLWGELLLGRLDSFRPKGVLGSLNRDGFLSVLNSNRDSQSAFQPTPGRALSNMFRARSAYVSANAQLRLYVDEWLNTGRARDGIEDARMRDLKKAPNACAAVERFAAKQRMRLTPERDGLSFEFPSEERVRPTPKLGEAPLEHADRLFTLFLLCDWRSKLAKCRRIECGSYFELKHWNRIYKRSVLCPKCRRARSLEGAKLRTSSAREAAAQELYRLAGRRFSRQIAVNQNWRDDPKLKTHIIQYLNSNIPTKQELKAVYPHGITEKWLGWAKNRKGIEDALKKGKHAKG